MKVVLDAWPLTTILAGSYADAHRHGPGSPFRALCRAQTRNFGGPEVSSLTRFIAVASELWTTAFAAAEAFHHLEKAAGKAEQAEVLEWVKLRFPPPRLFSCLWNEVVCHPLAPRFGICDASVVLAAERLPGAVLLVQDGPLQAWCLRNGVSVRTCVQVVDPDPA